MSLLMRCLLELLYMIMAPRLQDNYNSPPSPIVAYTDIIDMHRVQHPRYDIPALSTQSVFPARSPVELVHPRSRSAVIRSPCDGPFDRLTIPAFRGGQLFYTE